MEEEILLLKTAVAEENRENGRKTATAFTWPVENRNGFVFGVLEAESRSPFAQTVMEIVRDRLARLAATAQEGTSIPRRFEQTLEAINEEIVNRAMEMETFPPEHLNAVIGLAVDKTMYVSGSGELAAIFLHKLPEGRYQVFNLARSIQTEQAGASWQKTFAVVLDGDLKPGDIFCLCNFDLQQEMPPEELHSLLATLPPQSAVVKLRQYFPLEVEFSLFVLKVISSEDEKSKVSAPASIKQLQASREQTKRVLSDQKPTFLKTLFFWILGFLKDQRGLWRLAKSLVRILISVVTIVLLMVRDLIRWVFRLSRRLASSERKEVFSEARSHFETSRLFVSKKMNRLPKTSKYLILAALIMVLIITFSVLAISHGRQASEERAAFEAAVTRVESLQDAVESALIYKDENKAKSLLKEAEDSLNSIVTEDKANLERIQKIKNEILQVANNLKKISELQNPEVLAEASALPEQPTLSSLIWGGEKIYTFGSNKTVYLVNESDKTLESFASDETLGSATEASVGEGFTAWLDDSPTLNLLDLQTKNLATHVSSPSDERWVDLYVYGDRLYVLAPGSGLASQVYRLSLSGLSVGTPAAWIKSPISELSDTVSLAVDGTVFILRANGKILRFVGGRDVAWTQGIVEPAITSASDIWTSAESSYVYLLDPAGQRLVVYEKESGTLKVQYHSSSFTSLTDFAVNETNKTIYLLGDSRVYKIEATHLK
ncbi:MAG: hypothetical protein UX09_C0030G0011 [Candidatus Uhrbacteria bacterium GW2011_GWE2_45_35]|uniref:PPM-type phosphatase domain-containing protein n=2 Tax=Candidatus Uhriibacteriota TaxID=1752732 RepID=A0A0G1LP07_9BACT|nr:MAG: hypothetical protein UW63_C0024G0006 [Candidatus Uhrbacteria bacterium GW2011_GWF2_44_350]KKU07417.1 MAG: hypothetical protein UX09_C0030G0011 [Candidatus Uhrbacteria bacterium GW2011_GWE2_45_35]HBR80269.1 hypothetical protein [Candidatus Uhrbacteria bacterium]HCU31743.1 hypothetical protein [Candidatus Uhrbacteria bacterium]